MANGTVVVDASLAVKWVLAEEFASEARAQLSEWIDLQTRILAPYLLAFEVANVIYRRAYRGELTIAQASLSFNNLLSIGISLRYDQPLSLRAYELASRFNRPNSYDAHYMALAEHEDTELWTADERLWNSVRDNLGWVRWIGEFSPPTTSNS